VLRRLHPYRRDFGAGYGEFIDLYYIEKFLATYQESIHGRVAEIGCDDYIRRFGGNRIESWDVLDINEQNERRTLTIDLTQTDRVPENLYHCIICTQVLFEIYDYASAIRSLYKMLRPAGVLLVTVPGISPSVRGRMLGGAGDDWWRFTERSARRAFSEVFAPDNVVVHTYGNVLTAVAFMHGLVQEELTPEEFDYHDPNYEVTVAVKATKEAPDNTAATRIKGLVSVTIPFLNAERFLAESIESVLAQTYSQWELLLVDDGSTDGSSEIALAYAARFPEKIRYFEHPGHRNLGVNRARDLGAEWSNGEFLAFLDSDDFWMREKLADHVASLRAHPEAGLMFCSTLWWHDWDPERDERQTNHIPPIAPGGQVHFPPYLLSRSYPLGEFGSPCPSSLLMRKSAFDRIGGFDECFNLTTFQQYEDIAFLAKVYLNIPVFVSKTCLDKNRCNRFSMSYRLAGSSREEAARRFYFKWLKQYLMDHGVVDRETWIAVRKQAWFYSVPLPASTVKFVRRVWNKLQRTLSRERQG
jgi:glycosyltransferase involved in cell wall biosynthesis